MKREMHPEQYCLPSEFKTAWDQVVMSTLRACETLDQMSSSGRANIKRECMHELLYQRHDMPFYTSRPRGPNFPNSISKRRAVLLRRGSTGTSADTTELLIPSVFIPCL